jgi:hypothetical protein
VGRELPFIFLVFGLYNFCAPIGGCRPIAEVELSQKSIVLNGRIFAPHRTIGIGEVRPTALFPQKGERSKLTAEGTP